MAAGYHELAQIDCKRRDWDTAVQHLAASLRFNTDNTRARNLQAIALRKSGRKSQAEALLEGTQALDPLDWWSRYLVGKGLHCDLQTVLDLVVDYIRAGLHDDAITLLLNALEMTNLKHQKASRANGHQTHDLPDQTWGAAPLLHYYLGWLYEQTDDAKASAKHYQTASTL